MKMVTVDKGSLFANVTQLVNDVVDYVLEMRPGDRLEIEAREAGILLRIQPGLFRDEYESTADSLAAELARGLHDG